MASNDPGYRLKGVSGTNPRTYGRGRTRDRNGLDFGRPTTSPHKYNPYNESRLARYKLHAQQQQKQQEGDQVLREMEMMGLPTEFKSTKGTHVPGNIGTVVFQSRTPKYKQYLFRRSAKRKQAPKQQK